MAQKCLVLDWVPGKATVLIYPILLSDTFVGYFDRKIDPVTKMIHLISFILNLDSGPAHTVIRLQ